MAFDMISPHIFRSNISGLIYEIDVKDAPKRFARLNRWKQLGNWAWADAPPLQFSTGGLVQSPLSVLEHIILCDPDFRSNKAPVEFNDVSSGYKERPDIKGHLNHKGDPGCENTLTVKQAAERYPDRYPIEELDEDY